MKAFTMCVDLSGFTPLTETLMRQGSPGAEHLSNILNEIFGPLVSLVYNQGGFIPCFAGDAFVAIFPESGDGSQALGAVQAAVLARKFFKDKKSRFGDFTIGIKIGLSCGEVEWGIVGREHKAFYFRGEPIDGCSACQSRAGEGEILADRPMEPWLTGMPLAMEETTDQYFRILRASLDVGNDPPAAPLSLPPLNPEVLSWFLPESVINYKQGGEFRTVAAVFVSFDQVETHQQLDAFSSQVLDQTSNFAGYFKEIEFGDKGGVMVIFFGAPVSFENNAERALEFVLSLHDSAKNDELAAKVRFRTGVSMGLAFTGIVGGVERCQYAAVGNRVNLAARLMINADWDEILVDSELKKLKQFKFIHKGDIKYKGIKGNVPTFKLTGRDFDNRSTYLGTLIERQKELHDLLAFAQPILESRPCGVAVLYGEAGIGKSRLAFELKNTLMEVEGMRWMVCQADQILKKPFNAFLYFLRNYFEQSTEATPLDNRYGFDSRFEYLVQRLRGLESAEARRLTEELIRTRTVLAALIGLHFPDSLWDQLDAKGRYQNTLSAIINLLLAESLFGPAVIVLEDGHWIDDSSLELMQELVRQMNRFPVMLLVTSRYKDDGVKPEFFHIQRLHDLGLQYLETDLSMLSPEAVRSFAETRLGGKISKAFFELLLRTTNSNPFYLEQMLEYFSESQLLTNKKGIWDIEDENVQLSGSVNAILTARIDRLSTLVRETVKAAAVIGREFEVPVLSEILKQTEAFAGESTAGTQTLLREQIKTAERGQIWQAMNELRYIFRHSLLREAAYSMQLRTRLAQLHQLIAETIERLYSESIETRYVDLAFHFEQAGNLDKTCEYLRKAADYARRNYQNQQALEYYERLLQKLSRQTDAAGEIKTLLKKGKVLELIGDWDECEKAYSKALQSAKKSRDVLLLGQSNNSLGRLLMLKGDYQTAMTYLQISAGLFESVEDHTGIAKVYGDLGNLYFRQGQYEEAKAHFEQSLELSSAHQGGTSNAQIVANLGLTHMNQGNYDEGIKVQHAQLKVCRRNNDKQGMATLYTNLGIVYFEKGDYDQALESHLKGLELAEELGNKMLKAIATGCLGNVYLRKGRYEEAMDNFRLDLELCEELGDKQGIAITIGLIGELYSIQGDFYKAIDYLQKNLMLCEELGYKKGIAKANNTLGDVFYYLKEYDRSLQYYDKAIDITREINNPLVLGSSLVEKGLVLLATKELDEAEAMLGEAILLAAELGNPDLCFETDLFSARLDAAAGHTESALAKLEGLRNGITTLDQKADAYFWTFRIDDSNEEVRQVALDCYRELYKISPRFVYKHRMERLEKKDAV